MGRHKEAVSATRVQSICSSFAIFFKIKMKLLTILFALSFCLQANSLTCWKCSEICSDKRHVKNFNDCIGCDWSSKETCGEGVNHCIKINFPNGTVSRSCAYFALEAETVNRVYYKGGSEGDCFEHSNAIGGPIKTMMDDDGFALQCPCEGNLCNESPKTVTASILLVTLAILGAVLQKKCK